MAFNFGEMKSGNPTLRKAFQRPGVVVDSSVMTVTGAINKSGILLVLLALGGVYGWDLAGSESFGLGVMGSMLVGFILAMVISFKPNLAPALAPLYALAEGVAIGAISAIFEARSPGIAFNAMCLTFSTLGLMLALYHFKVIRYSARLQKVIFIATGAVAVTYLINMVMSMFGHQMAFLHDSSMLGIGISCLIVVIAAFNLILDFEIVIQGVENRAPKYMEWYAGFALLVTLVWLYLEILKLLSRLSKK